MNQTFKKFKLRHALAAILKSVAVGGAAGLCVAGILLLALKLSSVRFPAYGYALISVGAALLAGGVCFAILRPTDKRVAKYVDEEYMLHERVQTALEFKDKNGAVVNMQRSDAAGALDAVKPHKPTLKRAWQYPLAVVIALGIALAGILVPFKQVAIADDPFDRPPTMFEISALLELIDNVEDSHISEASKLGIVEELQTIVDELDETNNVSEVMPTILATLTYVDTTINSEITYTSVEDNFKLLGIDDLASAVAAADIYNSYRFTSYDLVEAFEPQLLRLINAIADPYIQNMRETFNNLGATAIAPLMRTLSANLAEAVENVQADKLVGAILAYKGRLDDFVSQISQGTLDEEHFQYNIDLAVYDFTDDLLDALTEQAYKLAMGQFVVNRLRIIFGLPIDDGYEGGDAGNKEDIPGISGDDPGSGGGYGDGDIIYGSDDSIYDPNTGKYVPYGELLNQYFAMMQEYLGGDSLTEEQKAMAQYYFEILFSGIKQTEN